VNARRTACQGTREGSAVEQPERNDNEDHHQIAFGTRGRWGSSSDLSVYSPWLDSHYYQCDPTYYGWGYTARYDSNRRIQARDTSAFTRYALIQGSLNGGQVCYAADFSWDNSGVWDVCNNGVDLITYKAAW
jgi:hypothetical protein